MSRGDWDEMPAVSLYKEVLADSENISKSKELDTLKKSYTLMTSEKWELHREALEDGAPCPLCGAEHHPYSSKETFIPVADELKALKERQFRQQPR